MEQASEQIGYVGWNSFPAAIAIISYDFNFITLISSAVSAMHLHVLRTR